MNISQPDKDHMLNACEYLKQVDRYFQATSLLTKFANLIHSFPVK